ncbi:MAG: hypothetical protein EBY21_11375, partial [Alphaproteobacteria bacterium]|nr:hypothetical protein [Alphaproteobacteria bacterium]
MIGLGLQYICYKLQTYGLILGLSVFLIASASPPNALAFELCEVSKDPSQSALCQSPALQAMDKDLDLLRDRSDMIATLKDPFRLKQKAAKEKA